ncbi:purine-cytosine permease family protein [Burkholderia stabilis]|uniref:purine-cytosine permease family protein n=1 Tax=Burkholderia stabilis TaxID=95485 RepID=UPI001F4B40DD|nr:cytosine permease [Burkholderia stabilis]
MSQGESIAHLEESTIQPIPLTERHGSAKDLFTIWFGSNIMMLTIVTGSLATTVFKQPFWWAALATLVGSLIGAVFMALHSAQGPQLGVPQMIQTRGQFGSFGALLVVGLVVVMYVGFFASNCVFGGQALHSLNASIPLDAGVVVIGLISLLGSIYGYKLIHAYARLLSWCSGSVLVLAFVWIIFVHGLPADTFSKHSLNLSGFLGAMSVAALWQIAYAPYVSDYSRYLPPDTGPRTAFWSSYWGCVLGSFFPMLLGCLVGLATPDGNVVSGLTGLTQGISVLVIVVLSFGIAASNAMELYCGALSAITVLQTLFPSWSGKARARAITAIVLCGIALAIALFGQDNFLAGYTNFILLLLYVLVPWTAINLVDYYLVCHGEYDVDSFFRQDGGIYGRFNAIAVGSYFIGIVAQAPFMATDLYTGELASRLGGADVSWIVGLSLTSLVYYAGCKLFSRPLHGVAASVDGVSR